MSFVLLHPSVKLYVWSLVSIFKQVKIIDKTIMISIDSGIGLLILRPCWPYSVELVSIDELVRS